MYYSVIQTVVNHKKKARTYIRINDVDQPDYRTCHRVVLISLHSVGRLSDMDIDGYCRARLERVE